MQLTDRIRQVKIFLVVAAIIIAVVSLLVSRYLVQDLASEERNKMEVWAEAMRALNKADENTDMNLVLKVIDENNTIPVVVLDSDGQAQIFRNLKVKGKTYNDTLAYATEQGLLMKKAGRSIRIGLDEISDSDYIEVCYDESTMLRRLNVYPFWVLGLVMLFVVIAIFALLTSKKAEQNKVWVGLSKETAHQLGTPISSLMAWTEILKETYPDDALIPEMEQDVKRLQLIAERFSKIGSLPEPVPSSLLEVMTHVVDYMDRRTSNKVVMVSRFPEQDIIVKINSSLFEWVIENLCKNAVDAMEGSGTITLFMEEVKDKVIIEISDTGKGISRKNMKNVFKPGFTTKKRGWGLGLSLAKRIVEEYHKGKIYVFNSEIGKGTTFRIELKK
ncbi:HAMP domain-containing sensor histidine kinase [Prevotella koreensis]|uniref:sensor histidine kinase n=1 Tax=Prevotella koreensis TaxID=2490854 RepID=UPI0028E7D872|nr:HAMP domain-containing sensor histidine kinase [Prevotella koreensis]